ncbi:hypothetical protein QTV43_000104 [Vibrio vulnificus]|nr:hypothetical protein [Vibrio vulnificus]
MSNQQVTVEIGSNLFIMEVSSKQSDGSWKKHQSGIFTMREVGQEELQRILSQNEKHEDHGVSFRVRRSLDNIDRIKFERLVGNWWESYTEYALIPVELKA